MPDTSTAPTATTSQVFSVGTKMLGFYLNGSGLQVDALIPAAEFAPASVVTDVNAAAASAAASAAVLGGTAQFSYVPHKGSDSATDVTWISRGALGEVPLANVALQTSANYQLLIANFSNPSTRVTSAVVSSKLRVTSNQLAVFATGAAVGYRAWTDRTFKGGGKTISVAGTLSNSGFGPIFTGTAPTTGGPTAVMNADAVFIVLRAVGAVVALQRDGVNAAPGVTIIGATSTPWSAGQTITWTFRAISSTSVAISFFADGSLLQAVTVSGLPANSYVMNGVRWTSTDTIEFVDMTISEKSLDVLRTINLDPNNAGVAIGTEANPFVSMDQAIEACEIDSARRDINLVLKAGVYRGTMEFNADRWRRIRIKGAKGQGSIIKPSFALSGAVWTQIGTSEVWHTAHRWGSAVNSTSGSGGVVETTTGITQAFGRTGLVTVSNRKLYTRQTLNTSDTVLARGEYTIHTASTYAGKILVRCHDGGDPNTKTWEQMTYSYGISCLGSGATGWNACQFEVSDLSIYHPLTYGLFGKFINAIAENVAVYGTGQSFGFEFGESNLRAMGCLVEGSAADGYHSIDGYSADATRRIPVHIYDDCDSMGQFVSTTGVVGDGWSNHRGHRYFLNNCRAWSAGKDGLSAGDEFRLSNFDARDCVNAGVSLGGYADTTVPLSVINGGLMKGNNIGVVLNFGAVNNINSFLDVMRVHCADNARSSFETFSGGTGCSGQITAYNCTTSGAVPSLGHRKEAGLSIVPITGAALV